MRRGTTPTVKIRIRGMPVEELRNIYITFQQGTKEITKENQDITLEEEYLLVTLSQQETLDLARGSILVQVRAITSTGLAVASPIKSLKMEDILLDRVIT